MKGLTFFGNRQRLQAPEFFNAPVLLSIALFAANNIWLKSAFPGWLTGKLSDFLFCFFFPLYCSAVIGMVHPRFVRPRIYMGALMTLAVFTAMKMLPSFSDQVSSVFSYLSELIHLGPSRNIVDKTDLVATPAVGVAVIFGRSRLRQLIENGWVQYRPTNAE